MKVCTSCGKQRRLGSFYKNPTGRFGYAAICKDCARLQNTEYRRAHKQVVPRESYLQNEYGMSRKEWETLFIKQDGFCIVCGDWLNLDSTNGHKRIAVDHDHATGKVRGLLCQRCNLGIGLLRDNLYILEKAVSYLERV